jgi:hypothetical protein
MKVAAMQELKAEISSCAVENVGRRIVDSGWALKPKTQGLSRTKKYARPEPLMEVKKAQMMQKSIVEDI